MVALRDWLELPGFCIYGGLAAQTCEAKRPALNIYWRCFGRSRGSVSSAEYDSLG